MAGRDVASPGHKLGQIVGVLIERILGAPLIRFAKHHGLFCDRQGDRPGVREGRKVTWRDSRGNPHDLDYVLERRGTPSDRGDPVAFIESAWRRYTKHSRNKSGEIEGALLPLRETYPTVRFLGVILAGEYSSGGLRQLQSAGIEVLHIPFETFANVFRSHGLEISYPEKATPSQKSALNKALESLTPVKIDAVSSTIWHAISSSYDQFESRLRVALTEEALRVRVVTLYGDETVYRSISEAIKKIEHPEMVRELDLSVPRGFELFIDYPSGAKVSGRFQTKDELLNFLKRVAA